MDSQSFLVTGGCGLQGSSIVETLRARYPAARVAVLARNPTVNNFPGVDYHRGDITKPEDIDACLAASSATVVFHCAAVVVGAKKPVPDTVVQAINVDGTRLLLERCKAFGTVKAFIFTSSVSVVQKPGVQIDGAKETWPLVDPEKDTTVLIYPRSKAAAEQLVTAADDDEVDGMRTCSIRPSVVHGERDTDVTPITIRTARMLRNIQIGDNTSTLSTTYVGNSTHAHLLAAEKLISPDKAVRDSVGGEAFFVTNEGRYTYFDSARTIWFHAGIGPPPDSDAYKPENLRVISVGLAMWVAWLSEWYGWLIGTTPKISQVAVGILTMTRRYDISKAKEVLGYREQVDWREGCRRAARWWVENNNAEDNKTK
ncbi:hypothetical protein AB5N19_03652 [Seiridium cardinale]